MDVNSQKVQLFYERQVRKSMYWVYFSIEFNCIVLTITISVTAINNGKLKKSIALFIEQNHSQSTWLP